MSMQSPWNSFGAGDGGVELPDGRIAQNLVHFFGGVPLAQTYSALFWLDRCFAEHPDLKCCLELGTLYGALSSFFGLCFPERVTTIDVMDRRLFRAKRQRAATWYGLRIGVFGVFRQHADYEHGWATVLRADGE